MPNQNPIVVAIREFFAPLIKLTIKLPPILAYSIAVFLSILVVTVLGVIIPINLIWLMGIIVLASLASFVFSDWDARKQLNKQSDDSGDIVSNQNNANPIDFETSIVQLTQDDLEEHLQEYVVVDHEKLFGVDDLLKNIKEYVLNPADGWIISLFGEGGIGKTALAYETIKRYTVQAQFTRFAWVSAKQRYFSDSIKESKKRDTQLQWAGLINQIADQLGIELGFSRVNWLDDFKKNIRRLPSTEKCLIVIDNLETVEDIRIVNFFENPDARIVRPHKLIITTRKSILKYSPSIIEIPVTGLGPQDAYELIRFLGRGNPAITSARDRDFRPILNITEGNPFLIKLIVRRFMISRKPINLILQEFKEVEATEIAIQVRDYLYVQSLKELEYAVGEDIAKRLMNAFCPRATGEQLTYEQLFKYSGITDNKVFEQARKVACDLSLIRVSGTSLNSMYSIHSLLWAFICKS